MQQAASQGQTQPSRTRPIAIAGLGAALVASAVTLVVMMSGGSSPVAVADGASTSKDQCQMIQRKLLVSTTSTTGGTVRFREGNYLSPPIKLGAQPQAVVFPLPRPEAIPAEEVLTMEGNATDVVITSDVTAMRRVLNVNGLTAFNVIWKSMKNC